MPDEIAVANIDMPKVSAPLPFATVAILAAVILPFLSTAAPATPNTPAMSPAVAEKLGCSNNLARFFLMAWDNLAPDVEIEKLDFISTAGVPAPFLIAITVE